MAIPAKPTLTTPPTAPVRGGDRVTFANRANAYVVFIGTNVTDLTAAIDWQNTVFTATETEAINSATSATVSETAAALAEATANFKGSWASLTGALNVPASVFHSDKYWQLLVDLADVTAEEPGISGDFIIAQNPQVFESKLFYAIDEKSGGSGGASNGGVYVTRDLNTVKINGITGASLSSNRVFLPVGDYYFEASAPSSNSNRHRMALYNVSTSSYEIFGTSEYSEANSNVNTRSFIFGKLTISSSSLFEFRHYTSSTYAITGLGLAVDDGNPEIYLQVKIWKVG